MDIFSASPKPFSIHRKSSLAFHLKTSIAMKLLEFLGNYSDDVLAEYIIVLICNGKHQYQARDDLEAFLGEKSGEFVSWLWGFVSKYAHPSNKDTGLSDLKRGNVSSSHGSDADKDSRSNKSSDLSNNDIRHARGLLRKDEKIYHRSISDSDPALSITMIQDIPDSTAPLNKVSTEKVRPHACQNQIPRRVDATENIDDDGLTDKPPEMGGSTVASAGREPSNYCMERFTQIEKSKRSNWPSSCVQKGELDSRNLLSSTSGRSLSPRSKGIVSNQIEKSRGSVWDRLGKPFDNTLAKNVDTSCIINVKKDVGSLNQHSQQPFMPNGELCMNTLGRVSGSGDLENAKLDHSKNSMCKPNAANNIRRKRHFGEVTTGPNSGSGSLVDVGNMDLCDKEILQDVVEAKHPKAGTKILVSEVLDVKQRLSQIEMEMSKLRAKQSQVEREGKPNLTSQSGALKHPKYDIEGDIESRTVTVTNVHFAATKEALLSHFTKCGTVFNIVILMDKVTAQPKGAAYISFANKESVEKAVALSGTTFFSRTIRVCKKSEGAASLPAPSGQTLKAPQSRINRMGIPQRPHLQWRREPVVVCTPESVEDKRAATPASQHLPSSVEANSSSPADT